MYTTGLALVKPPPFGLSLPPDLALQPQEERLADTVYKVEDAALFAAAQRDGVYAGAPVDRADGFVHLSTGPQLADTLRLHFRGRKGLVVAAFRVADLSAGLRWEPSRGGALFPHFYGALDPRLAIWTEPVDVAEDGGCVLPGRLG